jgi:hypothetical protein
MAIPIVTPVVVHGIAGQKAFHYRRDRGGAGFQKQMEMIGYQRPSKTLCFRVGNNFSQPFDKKVSVVTIIEHLSTAYYLSRHVLSLWDEKSKHNS